MNTAIVNVVLRGLRAAADKRTTRTENGRRLADIVPPFPGGVRSLSRYVSDTTGLPPGTVGVSIGMLVAAGFVAPGRGFASIARWVVLDGEFKQ